MRAISRHYPVLLVIVPLMGAALCPIVGMIKKKYCYHWSMLIVIVSSFFTWSLWGKISANRVISYHLSGWLPPWGIEIRIDYLSLIMASLISSIGILVLIYSQRYVEKELPPERITYYYALYLLLHCSMLGFVVTGDIFNLFVFMEIFSISSYALVGITGERGALRAAFKYLLMGAVASIFVLLGITFLYNATGSLNMADISRLLGSIGSGGFSAMANMALVLLVLGFAVKGAVFPVHSWLPDAHSIAPSPISALLSALVVKMGIYGILRILLTVYGVGYSNTWQGIANILSWLSAIAVIVGSVFAIIQRDLKIMIAYSTVAQIGYIGLGLFLFSEISITGGIFQIIAHALAKSCLFLCAGIFIYKKGFRKIDELKGLGRTMPFTSIAFAIASLTVVGLPPSSGFVSKWYLLWGCLQENRYAFVIILLIASLLSAIYCFRVVYYLFFLGPHERGVRLEEGPPTMVAAATVLALVSLLLGIFAQLILPTIITASKFLLLH